MKKVLWFSPLILLISGCTVIGLFVDKSKNDRRQEQSDVINEARQVIVMQKADGEEIEAVFQFFSYLPDSADNTEFPAEMSFPQIGDSISVTFDNGGAKNAIFSGLKRKDNHFEFIFRPAWSTMTLDYYTNDDIRTIRSMESDLTLDQPDTDRIIVHYVTENTSGQVPLRDLSHLNNQAIKKQYRSTLIGLSLDVITVAITAKIVSDNLDIGFEW
jgi:hypothetical protein